MSHRSTLLASTAAVFGLLTTLSAPGRADATTILGSAAAVAVIGASTDTVTGTTRLNGDLDAYPGTSITGGGNVTFTSGVAHQTDGVAQQAQADALTAFNFLTALPVTSDLTGHDLGTVGTLGPGVYMFDSSAQLTGTLTLNFTGPNQRIVFDIGTTLTTASAANMIVTGGDSTDGIFWDLGSSVTFGTSSVSVGNYIATQSATLTTSASVLCGRVMALHGAVTMDTNTVSDNCVGAGAEGSGRTDFGSNGFAGGAPPLPVPEPSAFALMAVALTGLFAMVTRKRRGRPA